MLEILAGFLAASVRIATPLLWAATGELIAERAGVINLAVEGAMLAGCLGAALGAASGDPWTGVLVAGGAGMAVTGLFALVSVVGRTDQIIGGTALTLAAVGVTGLLHRQAAGPDAAAVVLPTFTTHPIPLLESIPVLGPALFNQPVLTYLALGAVAVTGWVLFRTRFGLELRAVGESPAAAHAIGVSVAARQVAALLAAGALAGLGGATLVLAQVGSFAERMTAGRGFIAIAIVVLGRWKPAGVLVASLFFGAMTALQYVVQAMGLAVPYQFLLMLPYVAALAALAGRAGRSRAPAGLGRPLPEA